jgi:hypothetical protein
MKIILTESQLQNIIKEKLSANVVKGDGAVIYSDEKDEDIDFKNTKSAIDIPLKKLFKNQKGEDEKDNSERVEGIIKAIKEKKDIEPIIVVKEGDKYRILDGNHRYQAYKKIGDETVKCLVIPKNKVKYKKSWTKGMEKLHNKLK